ncbi:SWR1 complex subunit vps71 [Cytospora mali]|uniref:SWR1 complex subunit vps71 n=1 Tax=Cytospora mali TaxID=578113 RepID=A0A194VQ64_CYTMA|nr:SWR1 complex subunit vps71 [Valsa mali]
MNNFGVIEVASAKTTHAPGWAYVPDTATSSIPSQSVSAVHLHVSRKKRAARNAADSGSASVQEGISARHGAKIQKEIEQLQRDNLGGRGGRGDAQIAIPSGGRDRDGKIRGHTPNVRKILASQKTFANHLDDFEAWSRAQAPSEGPQRSQAQSLESTPAPGAPGGWGRRAAAAQAQKKGGSSAARGKTPANKKSATPIPAPDTDVDMTDAPLPSSTTDQAGAQTDSAARAEPESQILTPYTRFTPQRCPGDEDPLLESWLPPLPTDEELRELIRAPPLNYHQARGVWAPDDKRYPPRQFCEVCGYWGRVRCMKCGTRVCALDCMDVHREECITRYGL